MRWIKSVFTASVVGMLALFLTIIPVTGCTASQVDQVVSKISTYLPTALSLLNEAITIYSALGASENASQAAQVSSPLNLVQSDLTALQQPLADYLAATSSSAKNTTWTNIEALVDTATTDADNLLQIAAVKNAGTQATGVIVISSLDAAVHILDAYVSSAQSTAQVQAKLAKRTVKLKTVSQYWSSQDKQDISTALGISYSDVVSRAEAVGF